MKDVFFLGMWQLFCCSMKSYAIFFTQHTNSVLSLLTPVAPKVHCAQRWKVTWPSRADRSPSWTYSCPTKQLLHVLHEPKEQSCRGGTKLCCGSRDPSGTAPSMRCRLEWCLSSAQQIQLWVGVFASKGDTHFTQGVIRLWISLPQKFVDARLSHLPEKQRNSNEKELLGGIKCRDTRKSLSRGSVEAGSVVRKQCSHICFYLPHFAGLLLLARGSSPFKCYWQHPSGALERAGFSPLLCHMLSV